MLFNKNEINSPKTSTHRVLHSQNIGQCSAKFPSLLFQYLCVPEVGLGPQPDRPKVSKIPTFLEKIGRDSGIKIQIQKVPLY